MLLINMVEESVCIYFANENKGSTSLMRDLICGLRCRIDPDKAGYSTEVMFVDFHTQKSKYDTIFGRDARFTSLYMKTCIAGKFTGQRLDCIIKQWKNIFFLSLFNKNMFKRGAI